MSFKLNVTGVGVDQSLVFLSFGCQNYFVFFYLTGDCKFFAGVFSSPFNQSITIQIENRIRVETCVDRCIQARDNGNLTDIAGVQVLDTLRTTSCKCFFNVTKVIHWRSCFFKGQFIVYVFKAFLFLKVKLFGGLLVFLQFFSFFMKIIKQQV